jgi:5-methylthioadenosine/S-adenosylhomocysteine deaminase
MTDVSVILHDALIVPGTSPGRLPFFGWIHVQDGLIRGMGRGEAPAGLVGMRIDCTGDVLLPGLINLHAHSHSSLTRGSAEGISLEDWLAEVEREQRLLTEDDAYVAALGTYAEALLSGTTTILDMCLRPDAALRAAETLGIRAIIAPYVADTKPFTPNLTTTARLLEHCRARRKTVSVWVGLHDLESCSDDQIREGVALAKAYGTGLHLHCSESEFSVQQTLRRTGSTPVAHLNTLGALGPKTLLAHCVWANEEDQDLLRRHGSGVTHCPHANLKLGSGIAPIPAMLSRGVPVALGTDGAKANNRLDMFDVMKFASLLHKGVSRNPRVMPVDQILGMATERAAQIIGEPDLGILAPGRKADLITVRADDFHVQPMLPDTVWTNLVHAARGSDVSLVMVAGKIVARDGELVGIQSHGLRSRFREVGLELISRTRSGAGG